MIVSDLSERGCERSVRGCERSVVEAEGGFNSAQNKPNPIIPKQQQQPNHQFNSSASPMNTTQGCSFVARVKMARMNLLASPYLLDV